MNKMSKNEWLATKVMGYVLKSGHGQWYEYPNGEYILIKDDFNPLANIEQAFMLLDKRKYALGNNSIKFPDTKYWCGIWATDFKFAVYESFSDISINKAIIEAVLKFSGYYND